METVCVEDLTDNLGVCLNYLECKVVPGNCYVDASGGDYDDDDGNCFGWNVLGNQSTFVSHRKSIKRPQMEK